MVERTVSSEVLRVWTVPSSARIRAMAASTVLCAHATSPASALRS